MAVPTIARALIRMSKSRPVLGMLRCKYEELKALIVPQLYDASLIVFLNN